AEKTIESLCRIHQREFVICVPHNIIGPRQKYDDPFRNVAAIMINRMLQGKQPIIYGTGQQKRCFSYIKDTLQVLEQLVFADQAAGQTINVGPDEEFVTILELAQTIAEVIDFDLQPIFVDGRPGEDTFANCSADKARRMFSYETKYSLHQGIVDMVKWIQAKGPKPFQYDIEIEIKNELLPCTWREAII
ncbi:MAG: NAD-dependent epimerase/dehydratase family protein, partial [Bdellovibrionales bacterium]|nr:NAD-dependent epimerase/dehydratase family protein [Bdellovibrionales bacterium]